MPLLSPEHIHPILVNFTASLVPASVFSDVLGRVTRNYLCILRLGGCLFTEPQSHPSLACPDYGGRRRLGLCFPQTFCCGTNGWGLGW